MVTSGIRLGAPAGTTRGFGVAEFQEVGRMIAEVLDGLAKNGEEGNAAVEEGQGQGDRALQSLPDLPEITSEPSFRVLEIRRLFHIRDIYAWLGISWLTNSWVSPSLDLASTPGPGGGEKPALFQPEE